MGNTNRKPTAKLFKLGYYLGLAAFFICLLASLAAILLFLKSTYFWVDTLSVGQELIGKVELLNARLVMARIALLSCGLLAGLSFGFLGFSLFLIGIDGESDISGEHSDYKITLSKVSPGIIVLLAATILIGVCATRETPFWYERTVESTSSVEEKEKEKEKDSSNNVQPKETPPKLILEKP
jgi:hypothetical protein